MLQQITIFIDPFHAEPHAESGSDTTGGGRKLLQRRGGGRGGGGRGSVGRGGGGRGGFGRAGAVRVGGGGVARASTGRRGFNGGVTNNFIRRGGGNVLVGGGGWGGRGVYGGGGFGGGGYYGDYDPYQSSRALAYSQPYPQAVPVPVPIAVPTQASVTPIPQPPALSMQDVVAALNGVWRGDGGGTGMGQIVITTNDDGATGSFSAAPTGCANCAEGCRWSIAQGTVVVTGDVASVDTSITTCGAGAGSEATRATLERATNGRNVLYWTPATVSTKWVRNV